MTLTSVPTTTPEPTLPGHLDGCTHTHSQLSQVELDLGDLIPGQEGTVRYYVQHIDLGFYPIDPGCNLTFGPRDAKTEVFYMSTVPNDPQDLLFTMPHMRRGQQRLKVVAFIRCDAQTAGSPSPLQGLIPRQVALRPLLTVPDMTQPTVRYVSPINCLTHPEPINEAFEPDNIAVHNNLSRCKIPTRLLAFHGAPIIRG